MTRNLTVLLAAAVLFLPLLGGCGETQQPQAAPPPPTVTVATPLARTVIDHDEYVGRFVAVDSVEIRARVSGYLQNIHFRDGALVKSGDLLFSIDARPFRNTLDQARANLQQARANLSFAEADLGRAKQLVRERTIAEQVFDQRTQAFRTAQATVLAQEAAVRQAELDLQYTELRAPVSGRIGDRRVSPGNLVVGGSAGPTTLLANIVSIDPIRFEFTFDEASFLRYERLARRNDNGSSRGRSTDVALKLIDEPRFSHRGRMDFIDNVIDRSTGTIRGRAEFANPDGLFTPGMFARVRVPGSAAYEALLVPDTAIGSEQARKFVLTVGPEDTAETRYVTLGPVEQDGMRVIKDGIAATDRVIVNGLMRVRPGMKVQPQEAEAPAPKAKAKAPADAAAHAK